MRRLSGYPGWFFWLILGAGLALALSGFVLVPNTVAMRLQWDFPVHVTGMLRLSAAAIHSLAGFLSIGVVGALAALHMRAGWRRRLNHVTGIGLTLLCLLLLLTAVGIYYTGDPQWGVVYSVMHALLGTAAVILFIWHQINGRKIRFAGSS